MDFAHRLYGFCTTKNMTRRKKCQQIFLEHSNSIIFFVLLFLEKHEIDEEGGPQQSGLHSDILKKRKNKRVFLYDVTKIWTGPYSYFNNIETGMYVTDETVTS